MVWGVFRVFLGFFGLLSYVIEGIYVILGYFGVFWALCVPFGDVATLGLLGFYTELVGFCV